MAPMDDSAASSKDDEAKKSLRPSIKSLNASIEEVES
jgi:hypothetical protein